MKCTVIEAEKFAEVAHRGQTRKGSGRPYVIHPYRVSEYFGGEGEELARVVALLHDTLEDTATTYEDLVDFAGVDVAFRVAALSEDKSIKHSERKKAYLEILQVAPIESVNVAAADKIDNMKSMLEGGSVDWSLFSGKPVEIYSFYSMVSSIVRSRNCRFDLCEEYDRVLEMLWQDMVKANGW